MLPRHRPWYLVFLHSSLMHTLTFTLNKENISISDLRVALELDQIPLLIDSPCFLATMMSSLAAFPWRSKPKGLLENSPSSLPE